MSDSKVDFNRAINVAIFAHNEEDNIERCIQSALSATKFVDSIKITVLINGSSDGTEKIANRLSSEFPQVFVKSIKVGDKSNAWNVYVDSVDNYDENYYFLDGDNWLPAYSLDKLEDEFDTSIYWGIAPTPIGVKESLRKFMIHNEFISGNCYGVSGEFIRYVKSYNFKLPVGFIGDDSLVMYVLQEGLEKSVTKKRIKVVPSTGAVVPRLSLSFSIIRFMHRRYKRYALRHMQQEVVYHLGRENRFNELPHSVNDFGTIFRELGMRPVFQFKGVQTLYHIYAYLKTRVRS